MPQKKLKEECCVVPHHGTSTRKALVLVVEMTKVPCGMVVVGWVVGGGWL